MKRTASDVLPPGNSTGTASEIARRQSFNTGTQGSSGKTTTLAIRFVRKDNFD
jgi:hypothetical protein